MSSKVFILLYYTCVVCYYGQAGIFGPDTNYGGFFLIPLLLVNFVYCGKYLLSEASNPVMKACTAFLILNTGYFVFEIVVLHNVSNIISLNFYKGVLLAITCIYPSYFWSQQGITFRYILLGMSLFAFITLWNTRLYNILLSDYTDFVDNTAYSFVSLLPCVFLIKKNSYIKLAYTSFLMATIVSCAKRGAILCGVVACLFIFTFLLKEKNGRLLFLKKVFIICAITIAAYYAITQFAQNAYVMERFEMMAAGNSSNRDVIYSNILNNWSAGHLYQLLFGQGYCATPNLSDGTHFAHNDWIELLADTGIFGVCFYIWFIIALLKSALRSKDLTIRFMLLTSFIIWITKTLFSMSFMDEHNYILSILIGYALPLSQSRKSAVISYQNH